LRQVIKLWRLIGLKLLKLSLVDAGHAAATRPNGHHGLLVLQARDALVARLVVQRGLEALARGAVSHVLLVHAALRLEI